MAQKIALVTGANKGIGFEIVRALATKLTSSVIFLTARNESLGKAAVADLQKTGLMNIQFHQLDIIDEKSVIDLMQFIKAKHGGLDILVNNAAVATKGAFRTIIETNYFGTRTVLKYLLPLIRPEGRVVTVSSARGRPSLLGEKLRSQFLDPTLTKGKLDELMQKFVADVAAGRYCEEGWPHSAYCVSKIAATALTRVVAREQGRQNGVLINAVCPGWVQTDMSAHRGRKTPREGARTPVLAALLLQADNAPNACFFSDECQVDWQTM